MAGATPQTKAEEIRHRIDAMGVSLMTGAKFNVFAWNRLLSEIRELESTAAFGGASLLNQAVLWGFRDSIKEITRLFNLYAGRYGKDWDWHVIRANMSPKFGSIEGVQDMLSYGYPKGNIGHLQTTVDVLSQAGFFASAQRALSDLYRLDSELASKFEKFNYDFIKPAAAYLSDNEIDEAELAKRIVHASRVVLDNEYRLCKYSVTANEFGITFEFALKADIEKLVEMNLLISERLATDFDDSISQHLSIGVYPWEEKTQNAS